MLKSRVIIEDDGGNKVPLFNDGILSRLSGEKAGRVAAAAYDTSRGRKLAAGEIVVMAASGVIFVSAIAMNEMGVWPARSHVEVLLAVMVLCTPLMLLGRHFMRKTQGARLRAAFLGAKLCPSCGYDLPTTPSPAAAPRPGLVQCPECGAWWNAPPP